jgi:glycosyltransferase involved in cell wall biosynthesis
MNYGVVICSYNKLDYLRRTVEALSSIGRAAEYVLSDDGSTDGTLDWASSCGFFSKTVTTGENTGYRLCTVRNNGVSALSPEVDTVVLLDADCRPERSYFDGHDFAHSYYGSVISVGLTDNYDETGETILSYDHRRPWLSGKSVINVHWMSAYGGNMSFPLSIWKTVGGFDEGYNGAWGLEDADFVYMCSKHGVNAALSAKAVARHMRHPLTGTKEMRSGKGPNTAYFKKKHGFSPC